MAGRRIWHYTLLPEQSLGQRIIVSEVMIEKQSMACVESDPHENANVKLYLPQSIGHINEDPKDYVRNCVQQVPFR